MTVYAIAQLKFTDRDAYNRYQAAFMEVFKRYSGTPLAAVEVPEVIEGVGSRQGRVDDVSRRVRVSRMGGIS